MERSQMSFRCVYLAQINVLNKPKADLVYVVRLQQHFPQQTEEERRRALHGKVSDDIILVGHGFPLPVLLFHVLLQVEPRLLGNIVLLKESLRKKNEGEEGLNKRRMGGCDQRGVCSCLSAPEVELESKTAYERPNYEV